MNKEQILNCKSMIRDIILSDFTKKTPHYIKNLLKEYFSIKTINIAIKDLINEGTLNYTDKFGCNFLEISYNRPFHISDNIILIPPNIKYNKLNNKIIIKINPGSAFGNGEHPTTRLSLRGIEYVFKLIKKFDNQDIFALDIGTGSGILAIASVMFGARRAVAIDNDPIAIYEAKQNVNLNELEKYIKIQKKIPESFSNKFQLIIANLRIPTLIELAPVIRKIIDPDGIIVISGLKIDETPKLTDIYLKYNINKIYQENEFEWSVLIFRGK